MPLVLAIEPDPRQAATLKRVVRGKVRADLVVVDSKDRALAEIATRVPDLILVTALLPPRDENDLTEHLKALDDAAHLQTLTIPMFASAAAEEHTGTKRFGAFRRKRRAPQIDGCDPKMFGEQIEAYLQRAAELRAEAAAQARAQAELAATAEQPAPQPADEWASPAGGEAQPYVFPEYVPTYVPPQAEYVESGDQGFTPQAAADQAMGLVEPVAAAIEPQTAGEMEAAAAADPEPPARIDDLPEPVVRLDVGVEPALGAEIAEPEPIVGPEVAAAMVEPEVAAPVVGPEVAAILEPEAATLPAEPELVIDAHTTASVEAEAAATITEALPQEAGVPEVQASAHEIEASAPVIEAPSPVIEASAPEIETLAPEIETPVQEAEAPAPVLETFAPQVETSAEAAIRGWEIATVEPEAAVAEPHAAIVETALGAESVAPEPQPDGKAAIPAADEELVEVDLTDAVATIAGETSATPDEETEPDATPAAAEDTRLPPPPERHSPVHSAFARALGPLHAFAARVATGLRTASEHRARQLHEAAVRQAPEREHEPQTNEPEVQVVEADSPATTPDAVSAATAADWDQALAAFESRLRTDPSFASPPTAVGETEPAIATARVEATAAPPVATAPPEPVPPEPVVAAHPLPLEEQPAAAPAEAHPPKERKRRRKRRARPAVEAEPSITGMDGQFIATALAALRLDIERLRQDALGSAPLAASEPDDEGEQIEAGVAANGHGNGNGNGNGHGAAGGNGNGHDVPVEPPPPQGQPEPVEDEWGFYDPGRCGIQALMARLDEQDAAARQQSPDAKASAMSKLIASHDRGRAAAQPPAQPQPAAAPVIDKRLTPLSIWARVPDAPAFDIDQLLPLDAAARPLDGTARPRLAEQVAAVRYGSGCRIRRVRVAPPAKQPAKSGKRQVVILSKKALDELR